ncbi:MAG: glycine cleavage system aminomethyltransferase GcvT [Candidatus Brocadiaceae bacterium]|nr:glycine cleavage system aminomethyltransferase GcvT [Candidatus Brocadiaceae bacterium]
MDKDKSYKKTPLYDVHVDLGAKIEGFHGYLMPIQYDSILSEHKCVRNNAGIFDISHMGEFLIEGKGATELVQKIITNDVSNLPDYKALYSPMCDEEGGTLDDVIVYKYNSGKYLLVVNCCNIKRDDKWINRLQSDDISINNLSDQISLLAVQGPKSEDIIRRVIGDESAALKRFHFNEIVVNKMDLTISRTGYTGEDGFEIFVDNSHSVNLWKTLLEDGKKAGLKPAGLGARNTLRLEAGYLLYGYDIDDFVSPLEAGIGWSIKFDKTDFFGKSPLLRLNKYGLKRKLIAFKMHDKGIPGTDNDIIYQGNVIGKVTSGSFSPSLEIGIGLGYVLKHIAEHKRQISIKIRDKDFPANIVSTPFVKMYKKDV